MLTGGVGVARCGLLTTHPGGGSVPGSPRQIMTDSGSCGTRHAEPAALSARGVAVTLRDLGE